VKSKLVNNQGVIIRRRSWTFKEGEMVLFRGSTAYCKDCDWKNFSQSFVKSKSSFDFGSFTVRLVSNNLTRAIPQTKVVVLGGPEYLVRRVSETDSGQEFCFYKILFPPTSLVVWVGDLSLSSL